MANLVETSKHYGEIAEEKFAAWRIPGRYLVFGDRKDLAELKAAELTPLTAVLKEHDAKIREERPVGVCLAHIRRAVKKRPGADAKWKNRRSGRRTLYPARKNKKEGKHNVYRDCKKGRNGASV